MKLRILSFSGEVFSSSNVKSATIMTTSWEITILKNHDNLLSSIKPSTLYIIYTDITWVERRDDFAVWSWFVEVNNNNIKIMADMLVDIENLDVEEAERARLEAIKLMDKYRSSKDRIDMDKYIEAENLLLKSIAQLKLKDVK